MALLGSLIFINIRFLKGLFDSQFEFVWLQLPGAGSCDAFLLQIKQLFNTCLSLPMKVPHTAQLSHLLIFF